MGMVAENSPMDESASSAVVMNLTVNANLSVFDMLGTLFAEEESKVKAVPPAPYGK